ncbi:MAG: hypothetical protein M1469_10485 [Bacteroidetes bacterium]|nr:hypothetical protein [Bacteroidota bacterium]
MFEKEISNYAFNITKRYTGDHVSLSALMTDVELPESFRKFAEAEVKEIIDKEDLEKSKTGKFDFSRLEIKSLLKEIRHVLKNSFEFSREEFLELTDRASKFIFNYVIRPRWTLEKFLFKGEMKVNREIIEKTSRFLGDYSYYPKGILEYLEFHKKEVLDMETWRQLHAKIDEHLLGALPPKAANLTSAIFDLFRFSTGSDRVPTDALILFFRDKMSPEIVDRLEFAKELKNIQSLDSATLSMILEATSRDVDQKIAVLKNPEEPPKEFRTFERQTVTNPFMPQEVEVPGLSEEAGEKQPEAVPVPSGLPSAEAKPMDQQLSETAEPAPKEPKSTTPSIRTIMSAKLESKIVKKIFHGSRSGYQVAVHKLDESPSWERASKILEGIFIDNEIDPFSKYAVAFTDVVSAKFRAVRNPGVKF